MPITLWVDGDACPNTIKDILIRAAERKKLCAVFVANRKQAVPPSAFVKSVQVGGGFDAADRYIIDRCRPNDLVITADIPLAAAVVARHAFALNPRGELYTPENMAEHLAMRNLMTDLRDTGRISGGPGAFGQRETLTFANALDRFLTANA